MIVARTVPNQACEEPADRRRPEHLVGGEHRHHREQPDDERAAEDEDEDEGRDEDRRGQGGREHGRRALPAAAGRSAGFAGRTRRSTASNASGPSRARACRRNTAQRRPTAR